MTRSRTLIVISGTDTEPDLIESWEYIAATVASATRSGLSDYLIDEVLERRAMAHG